jgi:hypothetical protein
VGEWDDGRLTAGSSTAGWRGSGSAASAAGGWIGEAAGWCGEDEAGPAHNAFFAFLVMSKSVLPHVPHNARVRSVPRGIESEGVVVRRKGNSIAQPVAEPRVMRAVAHC